MSSLRRDLFERRLWPVLLVLALAAIAAPVLILHKHGNAEAETIAAPPAAAAPAAAPSREVVRKLPAAVRRRLMASKTLRDPFTASALATHPSYTSDRTGGAGSATTSSGGASTQTSGVPAASMVTPTPSSSSSSTSAPASASGSSSPGDADTGGAGSEVKAETSAGATDSEPAPTATTSTTTSTSAASTSTPATSTSTPATSTASPAATSYPVAGQAWTIYSADVRFGSSVAKAAARNDVARLTPLPAAGWPKVMFYGVTHGGRSAVFLLGAGVSARGPGICGPDHARCAAITLPVGQVERLRVPKATGGTRTLELEVARIAQRTTSSESDALAAYRSVSPVGLCELELANPLALNLDSGVAKSIISRACVASTSLVPFPGAVN